MKVGEAIKLLKDNGFEEVNQVGSYKKFRHEDGRVITIVFHAKKSEELSMKRIKQIKNLINDKSRNCSTF